MPIKVANAGAQVPSFTPPAKVLVLGCIDPRFASYLEWFLTHQAGIFGQYDLFVLAGSSLGVNQAQSFRDLPGAGGESSGPNYSGTIWGSGVYNNGLSLLHDWDNVFYAHLSLALRLHSITDVWIFDHLDCGAYKLIKFGSLSETDDDVIAHSDEIVRLACRLNGYEENPTTIAALGALVPANKISLLNIKGFVMDTTGDIFKVYDDGNSNLGGGYDLTTSKNSNNWLLPSILGGLVLLFVYFKYKSKK